MKIEECRGDIERVLREGVKNGFISEQEMNSTLQLKSWELLQPILDQAQGITPPTEESLKQARINHPLLRSDFTTDELEKLKSLAPDEYELLR